jgi:murein DD-endopeptidase MepM/ murein hydrolase activator NlpD
MRKREKMNRHSKLGLVMVMGTLAMLAACTPDTAETEFGWGVNERMGTPDYRALSSRTASADTANHKKGARTYIYEGDGYTPPPAPRQHPPKLAAKSSPAPRAFAEMDYGSSSGITFAWPATGRVIAGFGTSDNGERNDGINIAMPEGAPIKASAGGTVSYSGDELKDYGNLLLIKHQGGYVTAYAHADQLLVKRGDIVTKGEVIAYAGHTGDVTTPQLHFEIRHGTTPVDPDSLLALRNS